MTHAHPLTEPAASDEEVLSWYCLRTGPKQERLAMNMLRAETSVECYCPCIRFKKARSSGAAWVTEALFPCYVFARMNLRASWRHVASISGVRSIISFGGQPAAIGDEVISGLKEHFREDAVLEIQPEIQPGKEIKVVSGTFKGMRALVTKVLPARRRVAILMEILGMEREVEIAEDAVLPDLKHPLSPPRY